MKPQPEEYAPYYHRYISLVAEDDILSALTDQIDQVRQLVDRIPRDMERHSYAAGKWTVRELVGHVIDCERVFGFRAFCFSRLESESLPGFDQNEYVARSPYNDIPIADLVDEFVAVRLSNLIVLRRLGEREWGQSGIANRASASIRAMAYIMAGHVQHHLDVLHEHYGIEVG